MGEKDVFSADSFPKCLLGQTKDGITVSVSPVCLGTHVVWAPHVGFGNHVVWVSLCGFGDPCSLGTPCWFGEPCGLGVPVWF